MSQRRFLLVTANEDRARALFALVGGKDAHATVLSLEKEAVEEVGRNAHAAVFLDADNPASPGIALCRRLRGLLPPSGCALILFGSARGREKVVEALDGGADDFWAYPFNEPVCQAYLRAILRRVSRLGASAEAQKAGDLLVDPAKRQASLRGKALSLRSKELDLLYLLLKQRGKVLGREFLMESAWGREYFGTTRTIDFHISQLRRKLGAWGKNIETVAGAGYTIARE